MQKLQTTDNTKLLKGNENYEEDYCYHPHHGTYFIFLAVDGVNSSRLVMTSGLADSIGDLSRTINRIFNVECAITIMDDATHSKVLYGNLNGIDVTDYVN